MRGSKFNDGDSQTRTARELCIGVTSQYLEGTLGHCDLGRRDSDLLGLPGNGNFSVNTGLAVVDLDALVEVLLLSTAQGHEPPRKMEPAPTQGMAMETTAPNKAPGRRKLTDARWPEGGATTGQPNTLTLTLTLTDTPANPQQAPCRWLSPQ